MKTKVLILSCLLCCSIVAHAQLKVFSDGNVGIKLFQGGTAISPLSVGDEGDADSFIYFTRDYGYTNVLNVDFPTVGPGELTRGILSKGYAGMGTAIGVQGECVVDFSHYSANAIGVLGVAGGYSGENSAVKGILRGSNGVGIFGSVDSESPSVLGKFAGYFDGNVLVTGTINGVTISSSDIRFKKNIAEMESRKALNNVLLMKPIEYNLEQRYVEKEDKGIAKKYPVYNEKSQLFQKKHYGLIAQELQELYPDLVYEDDNGYLAVNYTGLIPVLVQSIQELNREVETLRSATALSNPAATGASLSQNTPNPFTGQTQIRYYLPATVGTAVLCVYDMQGKQLKQYPLAQRGEGIQNISGSEFAAGIYLYALVADGKEVDVKRMILTE